MSRSGYSEDGDSDYGISPWPAIIKRAVQGKPGIAFLREMASALDAMAVRELVADELIQADGAVCALGCVGKVRGLDMAGVDPEDYDRVARLFGITPTMAREVVFQNDDDFSCSRRESPADRWTRVRAWVAQQISESETTSANADLWGRELAEAGWVKQRGGRKWIAPDGKIWAGPYWAHHQMLQQREGSKP